MSKLPEREFNTDDIAKLTTGYIEMHDWRNPPPEPPREIPCVFLRDSDDNILAGLHWYNTRVMAFGEGDDLYDHVELTTKLGKLAMSVTEDFTQVLLDLDYPYSYKPEVDESTFEWHTAIGQRAIESFLEEEL